MLGLIIIG
jgi:hypothetical protein